MPTRRRRTEPTKRTRRRPAQEAPEEWPFPMTKGYGISKEFRKFHIPKDEYYYLAFPYANSMEETDDTVAEIAKMGLPIEYSRSPSKCTCYRVRRDLAEEHPDMQMEADQYETVEVCMPVVQYGEVVWYRFWQQDAFPYLHTEWHKIVPVRKRRRR